MSSSFIKNLFYTSSQSWNFQENLVEFNDQEAQHITRVLRHKVGDTIFVADGNGTHWEAEIVSISKKNVSAKLLQSTSKPKPNHQKIIAFGAIKKRDRLEFAIEKAVELGAWEICIFDADHSERSRLNEDRISSHIISAFKQSCRYYLPKLVIKKSLQEVLAHYSSAQVLMAYLGDELTAIKPTNLSKSETLLLVGPEGGFSKNEAFMAKEKNAEFIHLGENRLRAETAVVAFLAQYLFAD